jgi:Na+-driven multidrug efflux pump
VFIRNDNNPKLAMAGMITGSLSNIVLDYIFLFPFSMGMFGAALATGISLIFSVLVLSLHFLKKNKKLILRKCKIKAKKILNIIFLGSSAFIGELTFAISLITFNLVILGIEGNIGIAAYGIVANISLVVISIFTGVAQGIQPLISKGYGSGNNILLNQTLKYAIILVLFLAFFIYSITFYHSAAVVSVFNNEGNVTLANFATSGIKIYFIGFIFAGINIITASFFSAINNARKSVIISILRSCIIIIPMVIVLSRLLKMNGVWLSFVFAEFIVSIVSIKFLCCQKSLKCELGIENSERLL